jgi:hypothetical protein
MQSACPMLAGHASQMPYLFFPGETPAAIHSVQKSSGRKTDLFHLR